MSQQTGFLEFERRRIAYATVGEGPLLVMPAWWVSHVVEDWRDGAFRRFVETLGRRYRVVRYDRLGTGLSDRVRPPETLTLDYEVALLEAVIDHVGGERVVLFGLSCGGCVSAAYASRHPARVDRAVLYGAYACGRELGPPETLAALTELVRSAWGLGSRTLADVFGRSLAPEERDAFAAYQRASASAATAADLLELTYAYDVREILPTLRLPALVVHRERDRAIPVRNGREVAGLIPAAELVTLPGDDPPSLGRGHRRRDRGRRGVPRGPAPAARDASRRDRRAERAGARGAAAGGRRPRATPRSRSGSCSARTPCIATSRTSVASSGCTRARLLPSPPAAPGCSS